MAEPITSRGPNCLGPGYSPLGFNISSQYPPSAQPDPFGQQPAALGAQSVPTISTVRAIHYDATLIGAESLDGAPVWHLQLRPLGDPNHYPLRALWVDQSNFEVRKLTYAEQPAGWSALVDYSFKSYSPTGSSVRTWWISQIDATWQPTRSQTVAQPFSSTLLLNNVTFPRSPAYGNFP